MASHYSCSLVIRKTPMLFYANPLLAHLPAVQNKQIYALGTETFRLDYYSAMQVLERLKALFLSINCRTLSPAAASGENAATPPAPATTTRR